MRLLTSPILACALVVCTGCPKRDTGTINVDEIQGHVDTIDSHLKSMRTALEKKDLGEAEDQFEEAVDAFKENKAQLAAYPEVQELQDNLREAVGELCYGFVNVNLELFFFHIRGKDLDKARSRLAKSQKEFGRCEKRIKGRDDFVALKMNLDSAPQSLTELEKKLARKARLERIGEFKQELIPRMKPIRGKLEALKKNPNQRDLARDIDVAIDELRGELKSEDGFGDDPDWVAFAAKANAELDALDNRRASLVRRGKILWTAEVLLPKASKSATRAVTARKPAEALKMVEVAFNAYAQCADMVQAALNEEPRLRTFSFRWRGGKRTVGWLKSHCDANRKITSRMITKLTGKKPKRPAKKVEPKKPEKKPDKKPDKKPEAKTPPKKKKKKRRGRIRRW